MVVGQIGKSGAAAVLHVAAAFKHAYELALTLLQEMVVLIARGIICSPNLVIPIPAQVRVSQ